MAPSVDFKKLNRPISVGVILLNSETEILDVSPIDLLNGSSKEFASNFPDSILSPELKQQALELEFHWVTEIGKGSAHLTSGIKLVPTDSFDTCPSLDIVLMGAHIASYSPSDAEIAFIRKAYDDSTAFLTICGGFAAPLQAGLLQGKTVTAPRPMLSELRKKALNVNWVEKRWARDGKLWSSGALLNGLDLMSAFIKETWGAEGTLQDFMLKLGGVPIRDIDYKDVAWTF